MTTAPLSLAKDFNSNVTYGLGFANVRKLIRSFAPNDEEFFLLEPKDKQVIFLPSQIADYQISHTTLPAIPIVWTQQDVMLNPAIIDLTNWEDDPLAVPGTKAVYVKALVAMTLTVAIYS